jgi:hypothetical protein
MKQYINPSPPLLPESSISSHHFSAISHHVVQDFGPLLKYRHHLLGLRLVTTNTFNSCLFHWLDFEFLVEFGGEALFMVEAKSTSKCIRRLLNLKYGHHPLVL